MTLTIPALPKPSLAELQKEWSLISSIESDTSPTCETTLELETMLTEGENYIEGKEYETRIKGFPLLGFQHREWLLTHQDELKKIVPKGVWYIDFPALVVVDASGRRCVPYADSGGERWNGDWDNLADGFYSDGRIAVSGKSAPRTLEPSDPSVLGTLGAIHLELKNISRILEKNNKKKRGK